MKLDLAHSTSWPVQLRGAPGQGYAVVPVIGERPLAVLELGHFDAAGRAAVRVEVPAELAGIGKVSLLVLPLDDSAAGR